MCRVHTIFCAAVDAFEVMFACLSRFVELHGICIHGGAFVALGLVFLFGVIFRSAESASWFVGAGVRSVVILEAGVALGDWGSISKGGHFTRLTKHVEDFDIASDSVV